MTKSKPLAILCATILLLAGTGNRLAEARHNQPRVAVACPIPLRVTLTFVRNIPPQGSSSGVNVWRVDWQLDGQLPGGITRLVSSKVTVTDQLGSQSDLLHGPNPPSGTLTYEIRVPHNRTTPAIDRTPTATVESVAYSEPCNTTLTFAGGATTASTQVGCSIPLTFTSNPVVAQVFKSGAVQLPDGFAVRVNWDIPPLTVPRTECVKVKGFRLNVRVRLSNGSTRNFSESPGPDARAATIKVENCVLITCRPVIEEVKLQVVTEVKLFGSGRGPRS